MDITFTGVPGEFYNDLYGQMRLHIQQLIEESTTRFQGLLYRIDVSQREIDQYHRQMPTANYLDVLTELIIHREIKKVLVRNFFKSQTTKKPGRPRKSTDEDAF
jgi:hypothetical protein